MRTFVHPDCRRQGVSSALFAASFAAARDKGYEKIFTFVRGDNDVALSTYLSQGFQVIAVNFGETKATAQATTDRFGLTFPVLMDRRGNVAAEYRVLGLPLSFFVDNDGVVRERIFGRTMTKEEIGKGVQHYLKLIPG